MSRPLTGKQKAFIELYLGKANFNAMRAAEMAGYKGNGSTLAVVGHENLNKPNIKYEIAKRLQSRSMSADEVIARLADHARADYKQYLDEYGNVDLKSLLKDNKGHLIKGIYPTKHGNRIEFYDSQSALALLAKHHGLLVKKVETVNLDVDFSSLSDDQLKQLAKGEDISKVISEK